ncbi:MAG: DUF2269 domain-containing protein [Actinomycetota bacterium]|nr:DUF2269 domain-containing protein [Actinomycetota bacterium]
MEFYPYIKLLHILLAIVAVGFNASYGIWLARASRAPEHESHVLRTIKVLDDRFANPAYGFLFLTGLLMVAISPISISTFWISTSIGLWLVLGFVGFFGYSPTLRRQIALLESGEGGSAQFQRLAKRGQVIGALLGVIVLVILYLMVVKPNP